MLKKIFAFVFILAGPGPYCLAQEGGGQGPGPAARSRGEVIRTERLRALMSAVGVSVDETPAPPQGSGHREVRIVWEADPSSKEAVSRVEPSALEAKRDSFGHTLRVAGVRRREGSVPKHRSVELSRDKLMVAAVGAGAQRKAQQNQGTERSQCPSQKLTHDKSLAGGAGVSATEPRLC
jgi:hypothetical protein